MKVPSGTRAARTVRSHPDTSARLDARVGIMDQDIGDEGQSMRHARRGNQDGIPQKVLHRHGHEEESDRRDALDEGHETEKLQHAWPLQHQAGRIAAKRRPFQPVASASEVEVDLVRMDGRPARPA